MGVDKSQRPNMSQGHLRNGPPYRNSHLTHGKIELEPQNQTLLFVQLAPSSLARVWCECGGVVRVWAASSEADGQAFQWRPSGTKTQLSPVTSKQTGLQTKMDTHTLRMRHSHHKCFSHPKCFEARRVQVPKYDYDGMRAPLSVGWRR